MVKGQNVFGAISKSSVITWVAGSKARSIGTMAIIGCLAAGSIAIGINTSAQAAHESARQGAAEQLNSARAAQRDLLGSMSDLKRDATAAAKYCDLVASLEGDTSRYLGERYSIDLTATLADATTLIETIVAVDPTTATATLLVVLPSTSLDQKIDPRSSTEQLNSFTEDRAADQRKLEVDTAKVSKVGNALARAMSRLDTNIEETVSAIPGISEKLNAVNPSGTQAARDALTAALAKLAGKPALAGEARISALLEYVAAAKTLEASHIAEEARKAQEAADALAAPGSGGNDSGGNSGGGGGWNPGTGGGGGGGGGGGNTGGGGGGGNTGGGDGGGNSGGGGGSVDNNRYVQTNSSYLPMSQCPYAADDGTHDPGPGGTSVVSSTYPWSYQNMGDYIQFYRC